MIGLKLGTAAPSLDEVLNPGGAGLDGRRDDPDKRRASCGIVPDGLRAAVADGATPGTEPRRSSVYRSSGDCARKPSPAVADWLPSKPV